MPRTVIVSVGKAASIMRRCASVAPNSATIGIALGTAKRVLSIAAYSTGYRFNLVATRKIDRREGANEREIHSVRQMRLY